MNIEVLLTESEIANEFAESLEARDLPEKFFYWSPQSVRAWLELSAADVHRNSWNSVCAQPERVADQFHGPMSLVSCGAGDGARDCLLLKALQRAGLTVKYFPVDASQPLLELAVAAGEDAEIETLGIKADIASPVHLVLASDAAESPKLFLMNGNTLGGFDPLDQLRHLADCMRSEDRLILDGELYDATASEQVASPALRRFALAPLACAGISEEDGELRLEVKHDDRHVGLHMLARHFRAGRDLRLITGGQEVSMQRGERVFLNFRYRYTLQAFRWLVTQHARLKIVAEFPGSDSAMMTVLCSR